jgi:glycosyltransferase involved in cell wall biosynthesis
MIQFPCNLHNLYQFERDDERFVADLDAGVVIPVNDIVCDILNACSVSETDAITEAIADKHGRSEVFEALDFLSKLSEIGLLFSPDQPEIEPSQRTERPKIFLTAGVLESRKTASFLLNVANHHLLKMLTNHADLYLPVSETDNNRQEIEDGLRIEGIQSIFFRNDRSFSPAKFIPKDCDGVLALAPLAVGEQVFLKFNTTPVILRLSNEALISHEARNTTLERCAALRDFDAFACDASWTQTFFSDFVPDPSVFHHVPYGVDTSVFRPMDKTKCKHQLSQALGHEEILQKPLIGIVPGLNPHETLRFLRKLRLANPGFNYLVIHSTQMDNDASDGCVNFFNIASLQDKEASPFIFNALDALVFPAILGTSPLLLLEIVACGIPTVAWGYSEPEEISGACRFIRVSPSLFDPVDLPIESISQELRFLLENPNEQKVLVQAGLKAISTWTWEETIQRILWLFGDLQNRKMLQHKSEKHRLLFRKHYNPVCGEIESEAFLLSKVPIPVDMEQAIAMTLLEEHTPMEVKTVLVSICKEQERAEKILANLV